MLPVDAQEVRFIASPPAGKGREGRQEGRVRADVDGNVLAGVGHGSPLRFRMHAGALNELGRR